MDFVTVVVFLFFFIIFGLFSIWLVRELRNRVFENEAVLNSKIVEHDLLLKGQVEELRALRKEFDETLARKEAYWLAKEEEAGQTEVILNFMEGRK